MNYTFVLLSCASSSVLLRASVQSVPLFQPLSVTGRFALLVAVALRPKLFPLYFQPDKQPTVIMSPEEKARIFSSLSNFKGHVGRTDGMWGLLGIQSIRGQLDFETFFTQQILEIPTDTPTKVCDKKLSNFSKSLHCNHRNFRT